jgi:hypothetical protein
MYLSPDTTAILVADRRNAREHDATRRRSLLATFRRTVATAAPVPAQLPAPAGRTPAVAVCRAA